MKVEFKTAILLVFACMLSACGQTQPDTVETRKEIVSQSKQKAMESKMRIEIWSDIMCPFCYIGKRRFEMALEQFPEKDRVEIVWKSFQLMPELKTQEGRQLNQLLAEEKGIPLEQAKAMNGQVIQFAKTVGLEYNFDITVPANTFNAHRLLHFAKANGKQNEAKERLLHAYFMEGKNIDNFATLLELGKEIGLDTNTLKAALENGSYGDEVRADISEARQLGIRGVPFFLFNRKQAISGAQETAVFLQTLEKSFAEWQKANPETKLEIIDGKVCTPNGECD